MLTNLTPSGGPTSLKYNILPTVLLALFTVREN